MTIGQAPEGASTTTSPTIRPLRPGEEPEAAMVFQEAILANWRRPKPPLWENEDDRHAEHRLATGDLERMHTEHADLVLVAEQDDQIVGIAATTLRDDHAHIVYLFVLPEYQSRGVGRALLGETMRALERLGATRISLTASDDRRAWTRYLRLGLVPGAPIISMEAREPRVPLLAEDGLGEEIVTVDNEAQLDALDALDRQVKGATRRRDRLDWLAEGAREALVYDPKASGPPIGAYVVSRDHDHCRIGPVLARDAGSFSAILRRALVAARVLAAGTVVPWRVDVPARNQVAIVPLLEAGFQPRNLIPWFANQPIGQWDRYILRNEDLL